MEERPQEVSLQAPMLISLKPVETGATPLLWALKEDSALLVAVPICQREMAVKAAMRRHNLEKPAEQGLAQGATPESQDMVQMVEMAVAGKKRMDGRNGRSRPELAATNRHTPPSALRHLLRPSVSHRSVPDMLSRMEASHALG